jgi:hypothetical protein
MSHRHSIQGTFNGAKGKKKYLEDFEIANMVLSNPLILLFNCFSEQSFILFDASLRLKCSISKEKT